MKYITITQKYMFPLNLTSYFNLQLSSIKLQNKMKTNFRIICLKNDENRKYRQDKMKINNIIVGNIDRNDKRPNDNCIPNLVYLSARLQDDKNDQKRPFIHNNHTSINNRSQQSNNIRPRDFQQIKRQKAEELKIQRQLQIQKFFEEKQFTIKNLKNTMKNLLGSINFSTSKNKQKKISRFIKEACKSQRNSCKQKASQRSVRAQNKPQLQSDFHNFLANKHQEGIYHPTNHIEDVKLNRLSKVNPQQELNSGGNEIKALNLFHFLDKKNQIKSGKVKFNTRKTISSGSKIQSFLGNSRIEKIFNFQSNLETQLQQFEWCKLKDSSSNHKKFF